MGRTRQPGLERLRGFAYAHRGLHGRGTPENSMQAFRLAKDAGYGVELDIHLMRDGNLAVIHDASLKRTAGVDVKIEDLTASQLYQYPLEDTAEIIPLFEQVLRLYEGAAPIIVELKAVENCGALCEAACKALDSYQGVYCVESFDPRCIFWLRKHRPDIIRGQLSQNYLKSGGKNLPGVLRFAMTYLLTNFLTLPDFVAYRHGERGNLGNWIAKKFWGVQGVSWTVKTPEEYREALDEDLLPIFEGFRP